MSSHNRQWGVKGPKRTLRTALTLLVFVLVIVAVNTRSLAGQPPLRFLGAGAACIALIDLTMLWRGDLDYTHFQSKTWSLRINGVLFVLGLSAFVASLIIYG